MTKKLNGKLNSELAIIDFLSIIETEMKQKKIKRTTLAKSMECAPANITQLFQKKNLLMSTMMEMANAIGLDLVVEYVVQKNQINFKLEHRTNSKGESHVVMYLERAETSE